MATEGQGALSCPFAEYCVCCQPPHNNRALPGRSQAPCRRLQCKGLLCAAVATLACTFLKQVALQKV